MPPTPSPRPKPASRPRLLARFRNTALLLATTTVILVAHAEDAPTRRESVRALGQALDRAQRHLDEYGSLSVAAPVLTYARSNEFQFRLNVGASNYFHDAKSGLQGRAARAEDSRQIFGFDASAKVDLMQMQAAQSLLSGFQNEMAGWREATDARRKAADLRLQAALQSAATNSTPASSNAAVADAWAAYATNLHAGTTPPTHPWAGQTNALPSANADKLPIGLTNTNLPQLLALQPFFSLLTNPPPGLTVPNRTALITAAGDHTVEKLFEQITGPGNPGDPYNPIKVFGITTVSVQPGWRTRQGWAGEVVVHGELEFRPARQVTVSRLVEHSDWPEKVRAQIAASYGYDTEDRLRAAGFAEPVIQSLAPALKSITKPDDLTSLLQNQTDTTSKAAACKAQDSLTNVPPRFLLKTTHKPVQLTIVSPLTEVDTFDLASSYRRQSELALSLSFALRYAGAEGEARAFEKFSRSLQQDIATRTTLGSINAFSGQEGMFGFQIGPRLRALGDPADRRSDPDAVLERQTFPALVLATFGKGDTEPRLRAECQNDGTYLLRVYEPYLVLRQNRRWQPISRSFFSGRDWYRPGDWFHPNLRESERLTATHLLETARRNALDLGWTGKPAAGWTNDPVHALLQRIDHYEHQILGSIDRITLPERLVVPDAVQQPKMLSAMFNGQIKEAGAQVQSIVLDRDPAGRPIPSSRLLTFEGSGLDSLNPATVRSLSTNAVARLATVTPEAVTIFAEFTDRADAVSFALDARTPAHHAASLITPALRITANAPTPRTSFTRVLPDSIELARSRDNPDQLVPQELDIILLGEHLEAIDATGISIASGHATLSGNPNPPLRNALVLHVKVSKSGSALAFRMPLKDGSPPLLSLPVSVTAAAPPKDPTPKPAAAGQTVRLEHQAPGTTTASATAVTIDSKATPESLGTAAKVLVAHIEKEKPSPPASSPTPSPGTPK